MFSSSAFLKSSSTVILSGGHDGHYQNMKTETTRPTLKTVAIHHIRCEISYVHRIPFMNGIRLWQLPCPSRKRSLTPATYLSPTKLQTLLTTNHCEKYCSSRVKLQQSYLKGVKESRATAWKAAWGFKQDTPTHPSAISGNL